MLAVHGHLWSFSAHWDSLLTAHCMSPSYPTACYTSALAVLCRVTSSLRLSLPLFVSISVSCSFPPDSQYSDTLHQEEKVHR